MCVTSGAFQLDDRTAQSIIVCICILSLSFNRDDLICSDINKPPNICGRCGQVFYFWRMITLYCYVSGSANNYKLDCVDLIP